MQEMILSQPSSHKAVMPVGAGGALKWCHISIAEALRVIE
jgi:hypothetical protein